MTSYKQLMFTRTKKRALPFQTPSVRRLRPNVKVKRTNQFQDDPREENSTGRDKNGGFFNLENDVSTLPRIEDEDNLPRTEDDSDNSDDSLPLIEDDNNNEDNLPLTEDDSDNNDDSLPLTEDDSDNNEDVDDNNNDGRLPQTIEDEPNARFEPIQGEYGPYFSNFTEQMLFFWTTKHMIGNLSNAF